ncbi:hypothetical protein HMPREF3156_01197 [Neisseria sp. HMSC06F02]|nr:hypothetical protein HMPREF3156_01197 [Neisseria sp. HMSC06F02]
MVFDTTPVISRHSVSFCIRTNCGENLLLNSGNLFQIPVSWNFDEFLPV